MVDSRHVVEHGEIAVSIELTRSAPVQVKPFPRIEEIISYWRNRGVNRVLDVGSGLLRNALILVRYFDLWICEFPSLLSTPIAVERLEQLRSEPRFQGVIDPGNLREGHLSADAAVLVYVLHTLPNKELRVDLVESTIRNLKPSGEILLAAPNNEYYYKQRMTERNRVGDGHYFAAGRGCSTFYRFFSAKELDGFMAELGFEVCKSFGADKKNQRVYRRIHQVGHAG